MGYPIVVAFGGGLALDVVVDVNRADMGLAECVLWNVSVELDIFEFVERGVLQYRQCYRCS